MQLTEKHRPKRLLEAAAVHAHAVANAEGLNGRPMNEYRALIRSCDGDLRAALQQVQQGRMLRPFEAPKAIVISPPHAHKRGICPKAIETVERFHALGMAPVSEEGKAIAAEIERGKKFFAGSKKYKLHVERLNALRTEAANA